MKYIYTLIITAVSFLGILFGCVEDPEMDTRLQNVKVPVVSNTSSIGINASSIELKFTIEKENGAQIQTCGICWSTEEETLPAENMEQSRFREATLNDNNGNKEYTVLLSDLKDNTKYHVYAYATNKAGTGFSTSKQTYITVSGIGEVVTVTLDSAEIKATTALVKGVIKLRGESIERIGFYYSKENKEPSDQDLVHLCTDVDIASVDTFEAKLTDLEPLTKYYVRAFAKNKFGEFAFNVDSFTTTSGKPLFGSLTVENASFTSVSVSAIILQEGDAPITHYGFCWSVDKEPTIEVGDTILCSNLSEEKKFSGTIQNLESSKKYYVRAFAINEFGVTYSKQIEEISTLNKQPNVITHPFETSGVLFAGLASLSGELQNGGESAAVEWGICLSETAVPPTISDGVVVSATDSVFTCVFSNLKGATTYYYRAYGTNESGLTGYGKMYSFTTPDIFTPLTSNKVSGRAASAQFVLNNRVYVVGGDQGPICTDELLGYSPLEGAWNQRSPFVQESGHMGVATSDNVAYIMGGLTKSGKSNLFTAYYASANMWKELPPIATPRFDAVGFAYKGAVFMLGGEDESGKLNEIWGYDIENVIWNKITTPFPVYQKKGIAVVVDDHIYVGLGEGSEGRLWISSDGLGSWTEIPAIPSGVGEVSSAVYYKNDRWNSLFMVNTQGKIWEYNLSEKAWIQHSVFPVAANYHIFSIDDRLYILGQNIYNDSYFKLYDPTWD